MKMIHWIFTLFLCICSSLIGCTDAEEPSETAQDIQKDFYVLTVPKSGTFLLTKALVMLTGRQPIFPITEVSQATPYFFYKHSPEELNQITDDLGKAMKKWKDQNLFSLVHVNCTQYFAPFSLNHPEYVPIINIRDLRDVLVSEVFFHWNELEREIGPSTFEQKLLFLITLRENATEEIIFNIYKYAEMAIDWLDNPTALFIRFEDLVGERGGGDDKEQNITLQRIAAALQIEFTEKDQEKFTSTLFGNQSGPDISFTFREGKIGSWRHYFTPAVEEAFIEHIGAFQLALGYPLRNNFKKRVTIHVLEVSCPLAASRNPKTRIVR